MKLGLYGGTFDPVHNGHLRVARTARDAFELDSVVFVPCYRQPLKEGRPAVSDVDRLAMLKLATRGLPGFDVSDYEIRRGGVSYTWDTIQHFDLMHPDSQLHLVIGGDSAVAFHEWRNWEDILKRVELLVAARPGSNLEDCVPEVKAKMQLIPMKEINIAAEDLREQLSMGVSVDDMVPEAVAKYIKKHGLYA